MEKNQEFNQKDWLESITKRLLVKNYYKKFINVGEYRIYAKNIYEYLHDELQMDWLVEKPFVSKVRKILSSFKTKYLNYKKNERLKKIQNKYPTLQVIEAYYYLSLNGKFKLKNDDLELFKETLDILFAKIKNKKTIKNVKNIKIFYV